MVYKNKRSFRKGTKGANRQRRKPRKGRQKSSSMKKRIKNLESKIKDIKPEYKYVHSGPYVRSGQSADSTAPRFHSDETGHIMEIPLAIARGTESGQRIGHEVSLKRLLIQFNISWPELDEIPLWNIPDPSATNNEQRMLKGARTRLSIPCQIFILRFEHAEGAYADFNSYLAGFKDMFSLRENMSAKALELKKQEVKVIAKKSFQLRRSLQVNYSGSTKVNNFIEKPCEFVMNVPLNQRLIFDKSTATSPSNNAQNYRYGYVLKFGTIGQQMCTASFSPTKLYNPVVQAKWNWWYIDL